MVSRSFGDKQRNVAGYIAEQPDLKRAFLDDEAARNQAWSFGPLMHLLGHCQLPALPAPPDLEDPWMTANLEDLPTLEVDSEYESQSEEVA